MENITKYDNKEFYEKAIKKYGISAQGVHWRDKYSQYARFDVISLAIENDMQNSTIVDAGCGFGDFFLYLNENNFLPKKYIGIDREDMMIKVSKNRFKNVEFYRKNILEDELVFADYYVCSGSLNLLFDEDFFKFITNVWQYSKKGVIFNFLIENSFNFIKQHKVEKFCKNLTNDVEIFEYYLHNDVTFFLKK